MIHLDTNFIVALSSPGAPETRRMLQWLEGEEEIGTSAIAWSEYLCGPVSRETVESARELVGIPVPFDERDAALAAEMFNTLGRRRSVFRDCMIAASVCNANASIATINLRDFKRLAPFGVRIAPV